jgi:hypothetical protein
MTDARRALHAHTTRLKLVRDRRMVGGPIVELARRAALPSERTVAAVLASMRPTRIGGAQ